MGGYAADDLGLPHIKVCKGPTKPLFWKQPLPLDVLSSVASHAGYTADCQCH